MLQRFGLIPTKSRAVLPGDVFGRLRVVATGQIPGTYRYKAICECECGSEAKAVRFDSLKSGGISSCGCLRLEKTSTHHMSKSAHYHRWRHMMDRCYMESCPAYPNYGGRGIKVCPEWHDVANFIGGLPDGYKPWLEIDRIDNDGDYEPGNVRWANRSQNADNRRSARALTYDGRTQSLKRWSEETGINAGTLWERISILGWDDAKALTTAPLTSHERMAKAHETRWAGHINKAAPTPRPPLKRFPVDGVMLTIKELSVRTGITEKLLRKRLIERGWPVERAIKQ